MADDKREEDEECGTQLGVRGLAADLELDIPKAAAE